MRPTMSADAFWRRILLVASRVGVARLTERIGGRPGPEQILALARASESRCQAAFQRWLIDEMRATLALPESDPATTGPSIDALDAAIAAASREAADAVAGAEEVGR